MDERGIISLPLKVNGLEVKISPVAPLAMAQNMDDIQNILQYAQIAQQAGPQGQMAIKVDEMMDYIAEKLGVPQKLRPTPQERMMMQQQAAQMMQENPEAAAEMVQQQQG
jgi:hypothetical protein